MRGAQSSGPPWSVKTFVPEIHATAGMWSTKNAKRTKTFLSFVPSSFRSSLVEGHITDPQLCLPGDRIFIRCITALRRLYPNGPTRNQEMQAKAAISVNNLDFVREDRREEPRNRRNRRKGSNFGVFVVLGPWILLRKHDVRTSGLAHSRRPQNPFSSSEQTKQARPACDFRLFRLFRGSPLCRRPTAEAGS